jgi:hypothetical protein
VLLVGMAKAGCVDDGVEGAQEEEDEEYGTANGNGCAYGDKDRVLLDLLLLAAACATRYE